jgi:hypothetical protein
MVRLYQLLPGPELLWMLFFLSVLWLIRLTGSPRKSMDRFWINLANFVPFIAIPLTFSLFYFPGIEHQWLLLRVWVAGVFGAHYVLDKGLNAYSNQGPGVGTAYIMGMIFTLVMLLAGSVFVAVYRLL